MILYLVCFFLTTKINSFPGFKLFDYLLPEMCGSPTGGQLMLGFFLLNVIERNVTWDENCDKEILKNEMLKELFLFRKHKQFWWKNCAFTVLFHSKIHSIWKCKRAKIRLFYICWKYIPLPLQVRFPPAAVKITKPTNIKTTNTAVNPRVGIKHFVMENRFLLVMITQRRKHWLKSSWRNLDLVAV